MQYRVLSKRQLIVIFVSSLNLAHQFRSLMNKLYAIVLVLLIFSSNADAQRINDFCQTAFLRSPDSLYIKDLRNYFGLNMSVFNKGSAFSIEDSKSESDLTYSSADTSISMSIGIGYRWLSFGLGFGLGFLDKHRLGRKFDYSTQLHLRAFTVKLQGNFYKGYYLKKPSIMISDWPTGEMHIRKDVHTSVLRISSDYYFNYTKYSRKALTSQGQMQLRTAGSVLTGLVFNYDVVAGDSSLVPQNVNSDKFSYSGNVNRVRNMFVGPDIGYAITVVLPKQWFINTQVSSGLAYNRCLIQYSGSENKLYENMNFFMQAEGNAGYNGMLWFACLSANFFAIQSAMGKEGASINTLNTLFKATIAYRIKLEKDYSVGELIDSKLQQWRANRKQTKNSAN